MPKVNLSISARDKTMEVTAEFSNDEWEIMQKFILEAQRLKSSFPQGVDVNVNSRWSEATGFQSTVTGTLSSSENLAILLHRLRPLVLQDESTYFCKVTSILGKNITDPSFRAMLGRQKEAFDGRRSQQDFCVISDEIILNSERALQLWLNSNEYHRDPEKAASLERTGLSPQFLNGIFAFLLVEKVRAIFDLSELLVNLINRTGVPVNPEYYSRGASKLSPKN